MKKIILVTSLMVLLASTVAMAQMMGGGQMMGSGQDARSNQQMMEQQQIRQTAPDRGQYYNQYMTPGMMGSYGYGMGSQMMGGYGYGMNPGMMMGGYGMGPSMMGGYGMMPNMMGYGMGPGMMGYGMGPGMMGSYGYGYGAGSKMMTPEIEKQYKEYSEKNNRFLDETKSLRKELHSLKFEYSEALRSTPEPNEKLDKMRKEMFDLHQKIYNKSLTIK
jgi:hypothetical protein